MNLGSDGGAASMVSEMVTAVRVEPHSRLQTLILFAPLGVDYASLIVLSRLPTFFLLTTFYNIPGTTVVGCLVIDVITNSLPFLLLRPLLPQHKSSSVKSRGSARSVINDLPIRLTTSLLAAAIHATVIYVSYQTWLPIHLVEHFDGLRDISAAHSSAPIYLIASLLPAGYAARDLLFTPYVVKRAETERDVQLAFDPETATFAETLQQNLWGFSRPTKFLVKRLATVAVVTGSSTWLQTFVTLEGVESYGALGWSGMWVLATALTGVAFWWVGGA